jgi:hypothetical protein
MRRQVGVLIMKLPATDREIDKQKLVDLLERLDITNVEAARACRVTVQSVYRWLAGTAPIPYSVLRMFELMVIIQTTSRMVKVWWSTPDELEGDA